MACPRVFACCWKMLCFLRGTLVDVHFIVPFIGLTEDINPRRYYCYYCCPEL